MAKDDEAPKFGPMKFDESVRRVNPKTALPYAWDYWMYNEHGEYIYKYDHDMSDHPDAEFLEDTDCDSDFWATKFFWTVDQATALSFGRSPEKVSWDKYIEDMVGSSEFATFFSDLRDRILEAQQNHKLMEPKMPAVLFVNWAEENGLPFPSVLAEKVRKFFKAMEEDAGRLLIGSNGLATPPTKTFGSGAKRSDETETVNPKSKSNLLKIIFTMATKRYRLGDLPTRTVATNIEGDLKILAGDTPWLKLGYQGIEDHLAASQRLFGKEKK